ncbi:uncharacterized protein LOC120341426 [Styela clava]|uniref:uncharacterized protein LOC120341426 n=1 Tax=Styela clava TaxID=7725 RepID=UPI00193940A3|nr:uncharacterized protein LOC120341426 [Styela clava]
MGFNCLTLAVFLYGSVSLAFAEKCALPIPQEDLDISKLEDTVWYLGLQTNNAVSAVVTCSRGNNFTITSTGFSVHMEEFGAESHRADSIGHFIHHRLGVYHRSPEDEPFIKAAYEYKLDGKFNAKARKIDEENLIQDEYVFITDYSNYFGVMLCTAEGEWILWNSFKQPKPSLNSVIKFYNKLHELGVSARFHASRCNEKYSTE